MATIPEIENALLNAAAANNMAAITATINSITAAQKSLVNPAIYDFTLNSISSYTFTDDTLSQTTARNFMSKVGLYATPPAVANAMITYAADANYSGLDAVTDYLSTTQKQNLNNAGALDFVLQSLGEDTFNSTNDTAVNTAIRDLLTKVGTYVNAGAIANALISVASDSNYAGIDALTDRLTSAQKLNLNNAGALDFVVQSLAEDTYNSTNDTALNATIRDLMIKIGKNANAGAIANAMINFASDSNYEGLDAVSDYLSTTQKANLNNAGALDFVVQSLGEDTYNSTNDATVNDAVRQLMSKVGTYTNASAIANAMISFAADNNYAGLDAVTDYLNTTQKQNLNNAGALDFVIRQIAGQTYASANDTAVNAAARDLMAKTGAYINAAALGDAMINFAADNNYGGLDAVTDYLSTTQKQNLNNTGALDFVIREIAEQTYASANDSAVNSASRDFMVKLGTYISANAAGDAAINFAADQNLYGLDTVFGNISSTQFASLSPSAISFLTGQGYTFGNFLTTQSINGTSGNDKILALGGTDTVHGNDGNDTLFGNAGNDFLYGDAGNDTLYGGTGNDRLTGGLGADSFVIHTSGGNDSIADFDAAQDRIVLQDILTGYDPVDDLIAGFVRLNHNGINTTIWVDANGAEGGTVWADVGTIMGVTNLNLQDLFNQGKIVVV